MESRESRGSGGSRGSKRPRGSPEFRESMDRGVQGGEGVAVVVVMVPFSVLVASIISVESVLVDIFILCAVLLRAIGRGADIFGTYCSLPEG